MALLSNDYIREAVDFFVALSGVFDIPKHYQFERTRGVEVSLAMQGDRASDCLFILTVLRRIDGFHSESLPWLPLAQHNR